MYEFEIPLDNGAKMSIIIKRFRVTFESDTDFDDKLELRIIKFLRILRYGQITSSKQTENFPVVMEDYENYRK